MSIQVTATGGIQRIGLPHVNGLIPEAVLGDITQFLLDNRSGNIILNVQRGERHGIILGAEFQRKKSYK